MSEFVENARKEIGRADHLIFVSLKYTRTVDVLRHVIDRFISALDEIFSALLDRAVDEGRIESIPNAPIVKVNKVKELYSDDPLIEEYCDYFLMLRRIMKLPFRKESEYRRHVIMFNEDFDGEQFKFNIDIVTEDFHKLKKFFSHALALLDK